MNNRHSWLVALALAMLLLGGAEAQAGLLTGTNLVNLLRDAESIVVGHVQAVTDGVDGNGIPYTEITLEVGETIRGDISGTYTFRQFGLRDPRLTADGTKVMMPAPEIFPRYKEGEDVVLFLYPSAAWTGLQTTVGMGQGRFVLGPGRVENDMANAGVFRSISVASGVELSDNENRMLATEVGAVSPDTFLPFVRRAVQNRWVETCQMWNSDEGTVCFSQPKKVTPVRKPGSTLDNTLVPTSTDGSSLIKN